MTAIICGTVSRF